MPKRAWRKCIEYTVKDNNGKKEVYSVDHDTGTPRKVKIPVRNTCTSSR